METDPDAGRPQHERERYVGRSGLAEFPRSAAFDVADPDSFGATVSEVRLGRLSIRRTEHESAVTGHATPEKPGILRLVTVQRGSLTAVAQDGRPATLRAGDALFTCEEQEYVYRTDAPVVAVVSEVALDDLPSAVRQLDRLPAGSLPRTAITDCVTRLLGRLADRPDEARGFDGTYVGRGVIDLEAAVLSEVFARPAAPTGRGRVLAAAKEHMARNLADPELGPTSVAAALGVSVRYLHLAFDDSGTTAGRYLRERRLELVAETLRADATPGTLEQLAQQVGLENPERLSRAFRRRFGMSPAEFHDERAISTARSHAPVHDDGSAHGGGARR